MNHKRLNIGFVIRSNKEGGERSISKKIMKFIQNSSLIILDKHKTSLKNELNLTPVIIFGRRLFINPLLIKKLSRKLNLWHLNFVSPSILNLFLFDKKKKIITFHFMLSNKKLSRFKGNFMKRLFIKVFDQLRLIIDANLFVLLGNKIIFLTHAQYIDFRKYLLFKTKLKNKKIILPNFIENKIIRLEKKQYKKTLNIIYVGRLEKLKGFDDLVILMKSFNRNIKFHIIGTGNLKWKVENIKNAYPYSNIPNEKILKYYDKSSIFILPSYSEVFPMTILEAMARGLVILVSDLPGMREIIKEGRNGYFFPPGDTEKMKEIILYLKNNPKEIKRISKNNLKDIKKFTAEKQIPKYIKVYKEVLKQK